MSATTTSPSFRRSQLTALVLGALGLLVALVVAFVGGFEGFYHSYLYAFMFWNGLALGCLVLLFINHLAGGSWGAMIQRPLEAGAGVLPLMLLFFLPLLFGMQFLYPWLDPAYLATYPTVEFKTGYLNAPFFIVRGLIYFALWIAAAWLFRRRSRMQDENASGSGEIGYGMKSMSGGFVVLYVLTMTFAGIDWAMSITPAYFSGIYSVILMVGQAITAMSFVILLMIALADRDEAVDRLLNEKRLQDLGNFLMAFILFWAYTSFSQLIINWSGNIIETAPWYVTRFGAGWGYVAGFLLVFGFLAPFLILFSRWVKRKRRALGAVAVWAIFVQLANLFWFLAPEYGRGGVVVTLLDVLLLVGIGGIWLAAYFWTLGRRPLLPLHDPRLAKLGDH